MIALRGALGAGKSELARALIRARAGAEIEVPSPSYTLVQDYPIGALVLRHIDLCRLADADELLEIGLDAPESHEVWLVEWPERAGDRLHPDLQITLAQGAAPDARIATLRAGPRWRERLDGLSDATGRFLAQHGFGAARRTPLAGDASARRYERLSGGPTPAVLMHSPPQIGVESFLRVADWLHACAMSAPRIIAADATIGQLLLEDLGDDLFTRVLAHGGDETRLYAAAVDLLVDLQHRTPPNNLPPYDDAKLLAEASLLTQWYAPDADAERHRAIWQTLLPAVRAGPPCLVYVDYHADNLLWLPERSGHRRVGLLDFQDARLGPPAYDLVSLLEDARRDVDPALAETMIARYLAARPDLEPDAFRAAYAVLGAQRNAKILGLFARLAKREGKTAYLDLLPRVRAHLRRDLTHPALAPLQTWFAENVTL